MFNFLFEGKIGDMLAPIQSQEQQLHLAIQHHRNNEAESMINGGAIKLGTLSNGCADIHVACRFNNQYILEICLSRGVSVNLPDSAGNTPLHYAARNSHVDVCKRLVQLKANVASRNMQRQSPYDVAQSHSVRQFLLPLQLAVERDMPEVQALQAQANPFQFSGGGGGMGPPGQPYMGNTGGYAPPGGGAPSYAPPPGAPGINTGAPLAPDSGYQPPPASPHSGSSTGSAPVAMGSHGTHSAPSSSSGGIGHMPPPASQPPVLQTSQSADNVTTQQHHAPPSSPAPLVAPPGVHISSMPAPSSSSKRMIQADGFGSSASDPVLKEKYGHYKIVQNVAPPPTFGAPSSGGGPPLGPGAYSMFGASAGGAPPSYNRYVPYDMNAPAQQPQYPPQQQSYGAPANYGAAPGQYAPPAAAAPLASAPTAPYTSPAPAPPRPSSFPASSPAPPRPPSAGQDGSGMSDIDLNSPDPAAPQFKGITGGANVSTFNPATDRVEEVSATSTSSALM